MTSTVRDRNDTTDSHRHRRPEHLDVKLATSTNIPSRSSLISVSDHVEHLTDTALGRSVFSHCDVIVSVMLGVCSVVFKHSILYITIEEFNVESKAEYSALSSTRSRKSIKKEETKTKRQCPFNSVQVKIREVSPEGIRVTMEERICERDDF